MMFLLGWLSAYFCEQSIESAVFGNPAWGDAAFWGLMAIGCFLCEVKTTVTNNITNTARGMFSKVDR